MDEQEIADAKAEYERSRPRYEAFASSVASLTRQLFDVDSFDVESIEWRAKTVSSVARKMKSHPDYTSLDDVTDKSGVRVVTRYQAAVAPICEVLHDEFEVVEEETHGAESPQTFGYASRHLLVRVHPSRQNWTEYAKYKGMVAEIQVRSVLQHAWALISHSLDYKAGIEIPQQVRRRLFRVAAILETGDEIFDGFVAEVTALRTTYEREARDNWRALAVDLDSAEAVAPRFPWNEVEEAAVAAGWQPQSGLWDYTTSLDDSERAALGQLVQIARAAGITTWDQIARIAENIGALKDELGEMATMHSQPPIAIGPWVIVFLLNSGTTAARTRTVAGLDPARPSEGDSAGGDVR